MTEFNRVSLCQTTKEIWELFEVTYEGISYVKEFKISLVTHKYDVFKVEEGEMYNCSNDIIVHLKGIWKVIGKEELNRKLLLALLKEWRPKVMAIEEVKGLATMTMEELWGCFITPEHTLQMDEAETEINNKKDLALKILIQGEEDDLDG